MYESPTTSTATIVARSGSDSSAIAAYATRASIASSGSARSSASHSRSSGGDGAVRRRCAARAWEPQVWRRTRMQVRHVAVALDEARAAEHTLERLLHEILGVLP